MKLFTTKQIKELDAYTIAHEPITSIDLMERAAGCITDWLLKTLDAHADFKIFAGSGNNGGDALAVARLLSICGLPSEVFLVNPQGKLSADCEANKQRLLQQGKATLVEITNAEQLPVLDADDWVIDGLFGSGLNRPLEGIYAEVVRHINRSGARVIAIDIPSGLFGEDNSGNTPGAIIRADFTVALQFPKIAFLLPENEEQVGQWQAIDIKLHPEALQNTPSPYNFVDGDTIRPLLMPRSRFSHKGNYGHALFMGGSYGKMGAAVLASRACLHTGVGLLTVHTPECGVAVLQTAVPEAMCLPDKEHSYISLLTEELKPYSAIGIGCGLGTEPETAKVLKHLLQQAAQPLVLDADALNILAKNKDLLDLLPQGTIITPHPKEFERLTGAGYASRWNQIEKAKEFSQKHRIFVVLKGAYTAIACPDGMVYFNSTGNPGMATGGSGDVLCGMILSLLAQGYSPQESALAGVYLHGEAGDRAAARKGQAAMIASNIIDEIRIEY